MIFLMPFLLGCHLWFAGPNYTQQRIGLLDTLAAVLTLEEPK